MANEKLKSFLKAVKNTSSGVKALLFSTLIVLLGAAVVYVALRNTPSTDETASGGPSEADIMKQLDEGSVATGSATPAPQANSGKPAVKPGFTATKRVPQAVRTQQVRRPVAKPAAKVLRKPAPVVRKKLAPVRTALKKAPAVRYGEHRYTVVKGDSLWKISSKKYSNGKRWPVIYTRNKKTIGKNPNLIYPKQVLVIPKLKK